MEHILNVLDTSVKKTTPLISVLTNSFFLAEVVSIVPKKMEGDSDYYP